MSLGVALLIIFLFFVGRRVTMDWGWSFSQYVGHLLKITAWTSGLLVALGLVVAAVDEWGMEFLEILAPIAAILLGVVAPNTARRIFGSRWLRNVLLIILLVLVAILVHELANLRLVDLR